MTVVRVVGGCLRCLLWMCCALPGDCVARMLEEAPSDDELLYVRSLLERTAESSSAFDYSADSSFVDHVDGDSITLRGNAVVLHRGARLEAGQMVYHRRLDVVVARALVDSGGRLIGTPRLSRGSDVIEGELIVYRLQSGEGMISDGEIQYEDGFYSGASIRTRSDREFHVHSGSYTTCDRAHPHFDFYSPRIKVLVGDMAIARPVYFRVGERRLAWIPFYVFSLRKDRQSGMLTPSFGRRPVAFGSARTEWEVRNLGYYFAPSDYWDLQLAGDLRQRSGWLARVGVAYARRYHFDGRVDTRLENRQTGSTARWQWWTNVRHNQQLGESASLRASGTFQSSKDVVRDNSTRLGERLTRTLRSNLRFNRRWRESGYSLSVNASRTENLDTDRFDTVLPEFSLRRNRRALFGTARKAGARTAGSGASRPSAWYQRIYYDGSARLRNTRRGTPADTTDRTSSDLAFSLSTQQRPSGWLSLSSSLAQSWRDADLRSAEPRFEGIRSNRASAGATLSQTLYGMFEPSLWRITAVRHVVKPDIGINYQATRNDSGGALGFGGRPSQWDQNRRLTVRLSNSFWVKLLRGEEEAKLRVAQLNLSTAYDFDRDSRPLSDLVSTLSLDAGPLDARVRLRSEFYDAEDKLRSAPRLRQFEVNSGFSFQGRRAFGGDSPASAQARSRYDSRSTYGSEYSQGIGEGLRGRARSVSGPGASSYGYESGLNRDIDRRGSRRQLRLGHYYSRNKGVTRTSVRSWFRGSGSWSWRSTWHLHYSINYNLKAPGRALLDRERITAELLSVRREFHDWAATLNLEPSRFSTTRAFYFKAQFKDIPQIRFERGDGRR